MPRPICSTGNADLAHQVLQSLSTSLASPALAPHVSTALDKIFSDFIGERKPCMTSLFLRMTLGLPNPPWPLQPPLARMTSALSIQPWPPPQPSLLASTINPLQGAPQLSILRTLPPPSLRELLAVQTPLPAAPSVHLPSTGTGLRPHRTRTCPSPPTHRAIAQLEAKRDEPRDRRRDAERYEPRNRRRPASFVATTTAVEDSEASDSDNGPRPLAYTALITDTAGSP